MHMGGQTNLSARNYSGRRIKRPREGAERVGPKERSAERSPSGPEPPSAEFTGTPLALSSVMLSVLAILLAVLCWRQIDVADFGWQLQTGRLIAESGIPTHDVFTYPSQGNPWVELRWLFCLTEAWVVDHLGFVALNLLKTGAIFGAFLLCFLAGRGVRRMALTGPVLLLAVVAASHRFVVRPELVSMLLLAAFLLVLDRWRQTGTPWIYGLPLLQVLWTNSHPLFWLGPFLILLLIAERLLNRQMKRELLGVLLATLVACLANPYFLKGALFPLRLLQESQDPAFRAMIGELKSPFSFDSMLSTQAFFALLAMTAIAAVGSLKKLDLFWTFAAVTTAGLGLLSNRNLALFALASIPFLLHHTAHWKPKWPSLRIGIAVLTIGAASAAVWLTASNGLALKDGDNRYFGSGIAPNAYPVGCAAFLKERGFSGRMFNTLGEGSYLISQGFQVFFDPRLEVQKPAVLREGVKAAYDLEAFERVVRDYAPEIAVIHLKSSFHTSVAAKKHWKLAYFDACAAVYMSPSAAQDWPLLDVGERLEQLSRDMRSWPEAAQMQSSEKLETFLLATGDFFSAGQWAARSVERWPDVWLHHAILGKSQQLSGNVSGAVRAFQSAIRYGSTDPQVWRDLAVCQVAALDFEAATATARQAIERFPKNADCWAIRGAVELRKGAPAEATPFLERAVRLAPNDSEILVLLASSLNASGRAREAIPTLKKALNRTPNSFEANLEMAVALHSVGDDKGAAPYFEKARIQAPNEPRVKRLSEELGIGHGSQD